MESTTFEVVSSFTIMVWWLLISFWWSRQCHIQSTFLCCAGAFQ